MSMRDERSVNCEAITRRGLLRLTTAAAALPALSVLLASCDKHAPPQQQSERRGTASQTRRKLVWIPQAAGEWDLPLRVGQLEFCRLVGWDYQHIGNPVYSVQNHLDQLNDAISARPDVIVTELESRGMVSGFQRAIDSGVHMVIIDQGISEEATRLGLGVITQDPLAIGTLNGVQAATWAEKISRKKEGVILIGNGNPGSALIDALQSATQGGVAAYNHDHGTNFATETFADSAFDDIAMSMSKYGAHIEQKGDALVAIVGLGGASSIAIWKTLRENAIPPGKQLAAGSPDIFPDQQTGIEEGYLQWGIDQDFLMMGFLSAACAWLRVEHGYPYWSMQAPGEAILKKDIARVRQRTDTWIQRAKELNLIES
jgi:ABC-type sugar transport system substrate-binding protein